MSEIRAFERWPRGGADGWDAGAAGGILSADFFGVAPPAEVTGAAAGVLVITSAAAAVHGVAGGGTGDLEIVGTAAGARGVSGAAVGVLDMAAGGAAGAHGTAAGGAGVLSLTGAAVGVTLAPTVGTGAGIVSLVGSAIGEVALPAVVVGGGSGGAIWYRPPRKAAVTGAGRGVVGPLIGHAIGHVGAIKGQAAGVVVLLGSSNAQHGAAAEAKGRVPLMRGAASGWSQHPIEDDLIEALLAVA
jgi:hypothetical protein